MNWERYIHADPNVLGGKPVIKGTRLSVEFLRELIGNGWSKEQILKEFPQLSREQLQAVSDMPGTSPV